MLARLFAAVFKRPPAPSPEAPSAHAADQAATQTVPPAPITLADPGQTSLPLEKAASPESRESPTDEEGFNRLTPCRYGRMLSNVNDRYIGRSLQAYGEYCQAEPDLLGRLIQAGDVVVDAGANIGALTLFFARAVGDRGRVHAFEPQRVLFQTLCANIALNSLLNAHAHHAALGEQPGRIKVDTPDYTSENNFGGMPLGEWSAGEEVPLMRIDDLALERCTLIKIDVEGMEQAVLRGAAGTIARHRPILYVENDREEKSAELVRDLMGRGYRLYWHIAPYFNPDNFRGMKADLFPGLAARNMLCIPRERPIAVAGMPEVDVPE